MYGSIYVYFCIYIDMPKHICAVMRHVHMYEHIDIRIYKHTQGTKCTYIWIIPKAISYYNTYNLTLQP